jgi:alkyl hydroperoxide reductase subunit AhpC
MSLNRLLGGLLFVLLVSCKQELKVFFPENIEKPDFQSGKYMVIVYKKPEGCTSCALSNLAPWKLYKNALIKHNVGVLLIINNTNERDVVRMLNSLDIQFPVVFDKEGEFRRINDYLFKVAHDEVFVIDKDDNVIFTDSPIASEEKWNSFINLLKH